MVKFFSKFFCIPLLTACFLINCTVDIPGLFVSHDLDERLAEKNSFSHPALRTRQGLSFGDEYSFIVIADTHIENGDAFGLEKIKDVITAGNGNIKFVVIIGDITQNGSQKDIDTFLDFSKGLELLGVPCYPVIGNHDVYSGNWTNWKNSIGSTRYRIDSGNTTLFILDSANAYFGKEQLDWLESEIQSAGKNLFVFTHANFFVETPLEIQQFTDINERARVCSILRDRCDFMFMGHVHNRMFHEVGGVKYIAVDDFRGKQVYCKVSVTDSGIDYSFEKL